MKISTLAPLFLLLCFLFLGCDNRDGPIERTGEKFDKAIEDTGDALEDAGDDIKNELN
jgi:hypothetical protein